MEKDNGAKYPEKKSRELTTSEKNQIRARIKGGHVDSKKLADEFKCSRSQVAGIMAVLNR